MIQSGLVEIFGTAFLMETDLILVNVNDACYFWLIVNVHSVQIRFLASYVISTRGVARDFSSRNKFIP